MAWVEQHGERFHVAFRIGDRRFKKTLKTADRRTADALAQMIDERLRMIEAGHIVLPDGADLVAYLMSDGRLEQSVSIEKKVGRTLGEIIPEYLTSANQGSLESNSFGTLKIHLNHVLTVLGKTIRITDQIALRAGYQMLWMGDVALGGEAASLSLTNPSLLRSPSHNGDLFMHGATVGLELRL